jgi:hypothetical protein
MSAPYDTPETKSRPYIPEMAKEVIFWCAVFVVAATGAVLISQMGPNWHIGVPPAQSATVSVQPQSAPPVQQVGTVRDAAMVFIGSVKDPVGQEPPTF